MSVWGDPMMVLLGVLYLGAVFGVWCLCRISADSFYGRDFE